MPKRVMLAEQSVTIRGVAESLLRQNGFEVLAVDSGGKALQVIPQAKPDMLIIGAELKTPDGQSLYDAIRKEPGGTDIPLLLLSDSTVGDLPFPAEVIIPRPFEPREFMEKVMIFSGGSEPPTTGSNANPLEEVELSEEFLDAALGLDRIDVTDSEVMDNTVVGKKSGQSNQAHSVGFDSFDQGSDELNETGRVESITVKEDSTDISLKAAQQGPAPDLSASKKIDVLDDQYGFHNPDALQAETDNQDHDYEWFVNSMRDDAEEGSASSAAQVDEEVLPNPTDELDIQTPAATIQPIDPPLVPPPHDSESKASGVERFIDEFRREIERVETVETPSVVLKPGEDSSLAPQTPEWEETLQTVTPEKVALFARQFTSDLAEKIADELLQKINIDDLCEQIKNEIVARAKDSQKSAG